MLVKVKGHAVNMDNVTDFYARYKADEDIHLLCFNYSNGKYYSCKCESQIECESIIGIIMNAYNTGEKVVNVNRKLK